MSRRRRKYSEQLEIDEYHRRMSGPRELEKERRAAIAAMPWWRRWPEKIAHLVSGMAP